MNKKFISLLIILSIVCSGFGFTKISYAQNTTEYLSYVQRTASFLNQLGITDGINTELSSDITRKEFFALAIRSMDIPLLSSDNIGFKDVSASNPFAYEIYTSKVYGLTNGTSEGMFSPDGKVPSQAASKVIITILGYGDVAEYKGGYDLLANNLDLFDGANLHGGYLTVGDAYIAIYNALHTDILISDNLSADGSDYYTIDGKNMLEHYFGLGFIKGTLTTVGLMGPDEKFAFSGNLEINGKVFHSDKDYSSCFGKNVELWYEPKSMKAVVVDELGSNSEIVLDAANIVDYASRTISYDDNGKIRRYKLENNFSYFKNGSLWSPDEKDFILPDGVIRLIDNNDNGSFDYCLAEIPEYFIIQGIDEINKVIYDSRSTLQYISFADSDAKYEIYHDGNLTEFDSLKADGIYRVYMSANKKICRLYGYGKIISGTVDELNFEDRELIIKGTKYKANSYFAKNSAFVRPGESYRFATADDKTLTYAFESNTGFVYGYYLAYSKGQGFGKAKIKILTKNNEKAVFDISDRFKLNGANVSSNGAEIEAELLNGEYPKYQLVRYLVNGDELTALDTSTNASVPWDVSSHKTPDDRLTKYIDAHDGIKYKFRLEADCIIPYIPFSSTLMFCVPQMLATNPDTPAIYEDDMFYVTGKGDLSNDLEYYVDAYDMSEEYIPGAAVVYKVISAGTYVSPSNSESSYIVYDVSDAVSIDGSETVAIKVYDGRKYVKYLIAPNSLEILKTRIPKKGDIVRFTLNNLGEATSISLDASYIPQNNNGTGGNVIIPYASYGIGTASYSTLTYFSGKVLAKTESNLVIKYDNAPSDSLKAIDNIINMPLGAVRYVIYDRTTNQARLGTKNDIMTSLDVGEENASYVVCRASYYKVNTVFIYIN